ncbi:MAG TPA: serine/threonine-protein kinase [Polyangiaceae bacterium]|nr:serine/threonine-protein kinase [Polyangiaceae bacterium]
MSPARLRSSKYRPLFELGRGGMSRVHLAEMRGAGGAAGDAPRLVVLKELEQTLQGEPAMRAAMRLEAELSAGLNHPNVVRIFEVLECESSPVLVMEYLDGMPLSQVLRQSRFALPLELHLHVLIQMLGGLHCFHELKSREGARLNPVHRDVSPQNTFILHDGGVKLLDFGIAKVPSLHLPSTGTGLFKGKIQYMPPEQLFAERDIDRRADVFAAGIMLWEAVARRRMWSKASVSQIAKAIASGAIPSIREAAPDAPPFLIDIVERATQHERSERYASAQEMRAALQEALAEIGTASTRYRESEALAEFMRGYFGEKRAERRRSIEWYKSRNEASGVAVVPAAAADYGVAPPTPAPCSYELPSPKDGNPFAERRSVTEARSLWMALTVMGLGLGVGLMLGLVRGPSRTPRLAVAAAQTSVSFSIAASPATASLRLDGQLLPSNPYTGRVPRVTREATLEVSAPGHHTERRTLRFDHDTSISIALERDPARSGASRPTKSSDGISGRAPRSRSGANVASERKPASSRSAASSCTPPFYFSEEGSKIYRPECFRRLPR